MTRPGIHIHVATLMDRPRSGEHFRGVIRALRSDNMAEREGFEPPGPFGPTVFKTAAFDHSATSPRRWENTEKPLAPRKTPGRPSGHGTSVITEMSY